MTNNSALFKFKQKTADGGIKDVEIMVSLKHLGNFWRNLEMPLINCETNALLTWSGKCVFSHNTKATTFAIADIKHFVPVVTLSTQDNAKLLQQLESDFKRTINLNKYQSKVSIQVPNSHLDYLTDPRFQEVYRPFVL